CNSSNLVATWEPHVEKPWPAAATGNAGGPARCRCRWCVASPSMVRTAFNAPSTLRLNPDMTIPLCNQLWCTPVFDYAGGEMVPGEPELAARPRQPPRRDARRHDVPAPAPRPRP